MTLEFKCNNWQCCATCYMLMRLDSKYTLWHITCLGDAEPKIDTTKPAGKQGFNCPRWKARGFEMSRKEYQKTYYGI